MISSERKVGFASFSGPKEPLLFGHSLGRCGLKGAVISFTLSSVCASCFAQHCQGAALGPGFPGSSQVSLCWSPGDRPLKERASRYMV